MLAGLALLTCIAAAVPAATPPSLPQYDLKIDAAALRKLERNQSNETVPATFVAEAIIDAAGTLAGTTGQCKEGWTSPSG